MSWTVHPSKESPRRVWVIWIASVAAFAVGTKMYSGLVGLVGAVAVLGATAEFWLGTRYQLTPEGASSRTGLSLTALGWAEVKRVEEDGDLFHLSPLETPSRMDAFRGVRLRVPADRRESVRAFIERHRVTATEEASS